MVNLFFSLPEPLGSQGEPIVYPSSRRQSVVGPSVVRPPFSKIFSSETASPIKTKILCGASLGRGNESLCKSSRSHDQDGRPYMVKNLKNLLLQNQKSYHLETWHVVSGTQALQSLYK